MDVETTDVPDEEVFEGGVGEVPAGPELVFGGVPNETDEGVDPRARSQSGELMALASAA